MTEDEAKTKWCPFARQQLDYRNGRGEVLGLSSANRFNQKSDQSPPRAGETLGSTCIASGCMAWRWNPPGQYERKFTWGALQADPDPPEGSGWHPCVPGDDGIERGRNFSGRWWERQPNGPTGYCGLASKPD